MSQGLTFFGSVSTSGDLQLKSERTFLRGLRSFDGLDVSLTLKIAHKSSNSSQFRYYRGIVLPGVISALHSCGWDGLGLSPELVHKELFLRYGGVGFLRVENIGDMPRDLFVEYVETLKRLCAFLDYVIPDPGQDEFL